ncbi:putative antirestriction protein [Shigella sonnei]|nr:putative antirestriction protein [Shigella sonnei]
MQYAKPVTLNVEECDRLSFLPYLFGLDFLYAVGSENGGDGDAFVREEREAMDVVLQALDGEHMS